MLRIEPTNDKELLDSLYFRAIGAPFEGGVGFVLYYEENPIGAAKLIITETMAELVSICVVKEARGKGFGDFFTRVLMDNLTRVSDTVTIAYASDYYLKFGFRQREDGKMEIDSEKIVFPSKCNHGN